MVNCDAGRRYAPPDDTGECPHEGTQAFLISTINDSPDIEPPRRRQIVILLCTDHAAGVKVTENPVDA